MTAFDPIRELYRRSPAAFQRAMLVRRRERLWKTAGILFIHIPKAAGTSINEALYGQFMGHVRATDVRRWGSSAVNALPSFAVTRSPWDRLVSAYRFARLGHGVGGGAQAGVSRPSRYQVPEFETFQKFLTDWLAARDVTKLDGIFQPQHTFACDANGKVLVDHVGRVEDLGPTYEFIREHIGTIPNVGRSNRSGNRIDYRRFYTPELAELVGSIYRQDVEMFGYEF